MITLRKVTLILILSFTLATFYNCSDCDNENPRARVTNMGTDDVSVQIKTTGGNTQNINNIEPGKSSEFISYSPGEITYTIVLKNNEELIKVVEMDYCSDYEIVIDQENTIRVSSNEAD